MSVFKETYHPNFIVFLKSGLYAKAGSIITVTVPEATIGKIKV
jgi:hypothetical protein